MMNAPNARPGIDVESYSRRIMLTDAIKQILSDYPLGSGIVRELIQNSDDAGASSQILVLDNRSFGKSTLFDPVLERYQGPALLAFNDSSFTDEDWKNLKSISRSEKRNDISKAGKFGLGFNAVHHITDAPSVISGCWLALLDPHEELTQYPGGARLNFVTSQQVQDQLSAFGSLFTNPASPFEGTVIRLPLRTLDDASRSQIKQEETTVANMRDLMRAFIQNELSIALLFLKHLKLVELREVLETGECRVLARAELLEIPGERPWVKSDHTNAVSLTRLSVHVTTYEGEDQTSHWIVRHEVGDLAYVNTQLTGMFPKKGDMLREEKLYPHVAVALPLSSDRIMGRLFTSLPLPIETAFPVHIHALFALTSDRQSLRNASEKTAPGSREDILQRWNSYLFQEHIPRTWGNLLEDAKMQVADIYAFWPPRTYTRDDWKDVNTRTLIHTLKNKLPIWPLHPAPMSPPTFAQFGDALIDMCNTDKTLLAVVVKTNVRVVVPPPELVQSIKDANLGLQGLTYTPLTPSTVSTKLQAAAKESIQCLEPDEKLSILHYLYTAKSCHQLRGIPVIPLINGSFVALEAASSSTSVFFASNDEIDLFRLQEGHFLDRALIDRSRPHLTPAFNPDAHFFFGTNARLFGLEHGCRLAGASPSEQRTVRWLSKVHAWADSHYTRLGSSGLDANIDRLPLPLADGRTCLTYTMPASPPVMPSCGVEQDILDMFNQLNIWLLHKDFKSTRYLQSMRRVSTNMLDADVLLEWLEIRPDDVADAPLLRLHGLVSQAVRNKRLNTHRKRVLRDLPIFLAYQPGTMDSRGKLSKACTLFGQQWIYIMDESPEVLPVLPGHTLLDISLESNVTLIKALGRVATPVTPVTALQLAQLAAENLGSQPENLIDLVFERLILPHIYGLHSQHRDAFHSLRNTLFVTTQAGRKAPVSLIDTRVEIRHLFGDDDAVLPIGLYARADVVTQLSTVPFFTTGISCDMVDERIKTFASNRASGQIRRRAQKLLDILDEHSVNIEFPASVREHPWIPVGEQLVNARECRDERQRFLVSRIWPILPRKLRNPGLRDALGWSANPPNSILCSQFLALVNEPVLKDTSTTMRMLLPSVAEQFTGPEVEALRLELGDQKWLPVGDWLRRARSVFTSEDVHGLEPSFVNLPDSFRKISWFFSQMGVPDRPQFEDLTQDLQRLERKFVPSTLRTIRSIRLLDAICMTSTELPPDLEAVLIPDTADELCSITDVVYQDRDQYETGVHYVHPRVAPEVATRLRITKASARALDEVADDDGFGDFEQFETMQNKIRQTLLGYSYFTTFNEVLANADDAKATDVSIMYDKRIFSETGALSPQLREVHRGPALVIHNNAIFTDNDWKGFSQVGVGGKAGRDSIGRFGLGALAFYHWTDVPLIVSGHYALFLDPSGEHLPLNTATRQRRRGLKIDLRKVNHGRFDGTLHPLTGLFGFHPRNYFRGTLIRLPCRNEESKLLDPTYQAPDVPKFLNRCKDESSFAFLFTGCLKRISVGQYGTDGSTSLIAHTIGERRTSDPPHPPAPNYVGALGTIRSSEVTVSRTDIESRHFLVIKSTLPAEQLPPNLRQCAQRNRLSSPSVGLAIEIGSRSMIAEEQMRLMSTFPIGTTQLPVHLHGEFILSSDRTSILMDKISSMSTETQYNEFLLGKLAPPAYLYMIHLHLLRRYPTLGLWPRMEPSITETLAKETYRLIPAFPGALFETTPTNIQHDTRLVAARDAVFNNANHLTSVLRQIGVPNLITDHPPLSPEFVPSLQFDDAAWVKNLVENNGDRLQKLFEDSSFPKKFVEGLILHIITALGPRALHGLRLLPTTALHTFQCDSIRAPFLVASFKEKRLFFFLKDRFIAHLGHETLEKLLAEETGLNVRGIIPATDLGPIMAAAFPASQGPVPMTSMKVDISSEWIRYLCDYISENKIAVDDLRSFPFIPLSHPKDTYISAESSSATFPVESPRTMLLVRGYTNLQQALMQLDGFHIISQWTALPPDLIQKPEAFNISLFSRWLEAHESSWTSLDQTTRRTLAQEVKSQFIADQCRAKNLNPSSPLARLPIWECPRPNGTVTLECAADTVILPNPITRFDMPGRTLFIDCSPIDVRYLVRDRNYTFETGSLRQVAKSLGATVLDHARDLKPLLHLPDTLESADIPSFRRLLTILLKLGRDLGNLAVVPDAQLNLRSASDLFDPTVGVFKRSLYPSQLLHPDFEAMSRDLTLCGLKATLNAQSFIECAKAVDRAVHDPAVRDVGQRAAAVFDALLWIRDFALDKYRQLEGLAFIPKRTADHLTPAWRRAYLPHLNRVVSPSQLLLREHTPIAWTQRAAFDKEPPPALCSQWIALGKPDVPEVVEHLVRLTTEVAPDMEGVYAWNNEFIEDLRETYRYLQEQDQDLYTASQRCHALSRYSGTPIFLNVENPQARPWVWASAEDLVLDIEYDIPASGLNHVKKFLHPYVELLAAAGVKKIKAAEVVEDVTVPDTESEAHPQRLLNGLGELLNNKSGKDLTDVTLVATAWEDPVEGPGDIRAHRVVLAASSGWFRTLFCGDFQERERVELDMSPKSLQAIVAYFYGRNPIPERTTTVSTDNNARDIEYIQTLLDILVAADQYMLTGLKKIMENNLLAEGGRFVRVTTAPEILRHAKRANAERLTGVCEKFMEDNLEYFDL